MKMENKGAGQQPIEDNHGGQDPHRAVAPVKWGITYKAGKIKEHEQDSQFFEFCTKIFPGT